jgi:methionyl-tRNA formyltransferase
LLPKYRGAAPIEWALIRGEVETGVTLMKMDAGLDTGDMLAKAHCLIEPADNAASLAVKLSQLSAQVAIEEIPRWLNGRLEPEKQIDSQATFAPLLTKTTGQIDWDLSALDIEHLVRGVCIRPGAHTALRDIPVKLQTVEALSKPCSQPPGTIEALSNEGWDVATGQHLLRVIEIQLPGKPFQAASDVARGWRELTPGVRFTNTSAPCHPSV